jgi:hypothetical protein
MSASNLLANPTVIDIGYYSSPVLADIDGDNDLDLYIGENYGVINVYLNDGTENYKSAGYLQADGSNINLGSNSVPACVFEDIDEDNDLDLFLGEELGTIRIYLNDGNGNFSFSGNLQSGGLDIDVGNDSYPIFADLDEDDDLDLYVGSDEGTISIFVNDGTGIFSYNGKVQYDGSNIEIYSKSTPAFADIDKDNDLDLYVGGNFGNIKVYKNDGTGLFTESESLYVDGSYFDIGSDSAPFFALLNNSCFSTLFVGESGGKIAKIIVTDDINPVITSLHDDVGILEEGNCQATLPDYTGSVISADNCDANLDVTQNPSASTQISGSINQVILTVTDDTGNTDEVIFNVTVEDNTNPLITSEHTDQIVDADVNCEASLPVYTSSVIATDNCDVNLDVTQNPTAGTMISGVTNEVILIVTDDFGNTDQVVFNVEIVDNTNPVITSTHNDQTVDADVNCEASLPDYTSSVTVTDNCDANLDVTQNPTTGTIIFGVTNEITLIATDDAGNTEQVTFNVTVEDNTNPVITSTHNDQTVDADVNCESSLPDYTVSLTATDNCDADLDIIQNPTAGTLIFGVANEITITVTDDAGNTEQVIFNVTVEDNTNPVITCVSNQIVTADEAHYYIVEGTEFDPIETNDNCGVANIENDFNNTSTLVDAQFPEGTSTIIWTIIDITGNVNTCIFDVAVNTYVGIEILEKQEISIYPNPTSGLLNINLTNNPETIKMSIVDSKGTVVKSYYYKDVSDEFCIDLRNLINGIYYLNIVGEETNIIEKVIKTD